MAGFTGLSSWGAATTATLIDAQSMAANLSGQQSGISGSVAGLHFVWSGSPVGTLAIDISNDGVTWENISSSLSLPAVNGAGSYFQTLTGLAASYVRARYTRTSGTGVLSVFATFKG